MSESGRPPDAELSEARYILAGSDGILRSWGTFGGKRLRVWKVIVGGRRVGPYWSKRRYAKRAPRRALRQEERP